MIIYLLLIAVLLYCVVLLGSSFVLRSKEVSIKGTEAKSAVSIVVAVRNEEKSILDCIDSLRTQKYFAKQIVISNDDSQDETASLVRSLIEKEQVPSHDLILVDRGQLQLPFGKAGALHNGISNSENPIIVTTDADCTPPPDWVENMTTLAQNEAVGVVAGLTCIRGKRLLDRIQNNDWIYLQSASAALSLLGMPVTAMGNNMAFRKENYDQTGGYPNLPHSVTEDFVLFKSIAETTGKVALVNPNAAFKNYTGGAESWKQIFGQRKRWALGGFAGGPLVWALYAMTSATHWSIIALLLLKPLLGLVALLGKILCDRMLIRTGLSRLKESATDAISFIAFQGWLFFYMSLLPISLLLRPKVNWKGRTLGQDLELDAKSS